ncbi:MAG: hypothetical protein Kow0069_35930 [Promethearchaeota archaeon]
MAKKLPIACFVLTYAVLFVYVRSIFFVGRFSVVPNLVVAFPGKTPVDGLVMFLAMPFLLLVLLPVANATSRLYVGLHKVATLKKYDYYHLSEQKEISGGKLMGRVVLPAFVALSLGITLVNLLPDTYFFNTLGGNTGDFRTDTLELAGRVNAIFHASVLCAPVAFLLMAPLWLLEDAGVTFALKPGEHRQSVDVEGVDRYYTRLFKGAVAFTTLLSFGFEMARAFLVLSRVSDSQFVPVLLLLSPLSLVAFFLPGALVADGRAAKSSDLLLSRLERKGVKRVTIEELAKHFPNGTNES